jgi:hypothetical protein
MPKSSEKILTTEETTAYLYDACDTLGLTPHQLAKQAGLSDRLIDHYRAGRRQMGAYARKRIEALLPQPEPVREPLKTHGRFNKLLTRRWDKSLTLTL